MLTIPQLDDVRHLLDDFRRLVDEFEERDYDFHVQVLEWIKSVEARLERNRLPEVSSVAAQRLDLVLACRRDPADVGRSARSWRSKRERAAAEAARSTARIVSEALARPLGMLAEGRQVARQIVSIAKAKALDPLPDDSWPSAERRWDELSADADLAGVITHLVGLVGRHNAIMLAIAAQQEV